jgi:hypothetical protein
MGLSLGGRADKRLPKQQAARCGGERRPLKMEHIVRAPRPDRSEDPGCLNETRGEGPHTSPGRPRAIALATAAGTEGCCAGWDRHEQRALEPERDRASRLQLVRDGGDEVDGLELSYSATASRGSVRAQPKFPALTDPTSAQKTTRPCMRRTRSQKAAHDRVRRCLARSGSRGHSIGRTRTRPAERSRYGRGATAHDRL